MFIQNNATAGPGGGLVNGGSGAGSSVTNCLFWGNGAQTRGGGMYNSGCVSLNLVITNCTISGNHCHQAGGGGGILNGGCSPVIQNTILWGDSLPEIYNVSSTPLVQYSDIQGGYAGAGNINADPLFVGAPPDYHIQGISPCKDTGMGWAPFPFPQNNSYVPFYDLEYYPRPSCSGWDMGAYEYQCP
jgi:hypothetical protein